MKIKSLSRKEAIKYKPAGKTLMISIQDYEKNTCHSRKELIILHVVYIKTLCSYISTTSIQKIYGMVCQVQLRLQTKMLFTSSDF